MAEDLLGRPLSEVEAQVLSLYENTKSLLSRTDLAPLVEANLRQSLASLWQIVNDMGLAFEQLCDYGA